MSGIPFPYRTAVAARAGIRRQVHALGPELRAFTAHRRILEGELADLRERHTTLIRLELHPPVHLTAAETEARTVAMRAAWRAKIHGRIAP